MIIYKEITLSNSIDCTHDMVDKEMVDNSTDIVILPKEAIEKKELSLKETGSFEFFIFNINERLPKYIFQIDNSAFLK